ncbi:MAG TPA: tRNA lysidine(34) synthetase TilS [Rhizomicrobium sp.]|jgi:tRNA(Ile)-lysidine synthase|nr:tRNA lysidine(34) synthetase TilS [Rhizomicrobium sp.]
MADHDGAVAVAVSGGGDSLALMRLLAAYAGARKLRAVVLTVDHGLRKSSAADAAKVVAWARAAGLKAQCLSWRGAKPKSGMEAAAREARYRLMGGWLVKNNITTLLVGHTQDDQAETFLLRLARGSGLDGLAAMSPLAPWPVGKFPGLSVRRPLLGVTRAELRAWLTALSQPWLEDPMNDDDGFDRVKLRKARAALEDAGLSAARIAAAAAHLARARAALEVMTQAVLERACRPLESGFALDPGALAAAPREVGLRALAGLLRTVGGQAYRPRFDALERLFDSIATGRLGKGVTLHGCYIRPAARRDGARPPFTLLVERENPRKTSNSAKKTAGRS